MSLPIISTRHKFDRRGQNRNLKSIDLAPTPENRALVREYEKLADDINAFQGRINGLGMNYRRREIPAMMERLSAQRDAKMERFLEIEKVLFPSENV